jgi:hypothetical protein
VITDELAVTPGAVAVRGLRGDTGERPLLQDLFRPTPSEPRIEAHLVPDEAEVEARIVERMEDEITRKVERRLKTDIAIATEVQEYVCGLERRTVGFLVIFVLLMIGGIVGGVVYSLRGSEDKDLLVQGEPTSTPIMPVDDPLVEELRAWIVPTEQDLVPFSNPNSAQSQALEWLHSDHIAMSTNRSSETVLQRYILAVLYFATSGSGWLWRYLSSDDACSWNLGVNNTGVFCFGDGETVDRIQMSNNNLRGTLPWELVLLTNIQHVDFDRNRLSGTIPSRIDELTELQIFWAMSNDLTGTLPQSLPSSMIYVDLNNNALSGTIPGSWGAQMSNLNYLLLHVNSLTGTIPSELGLIDPLSIFTIYGNDLSGSVDQFFCGEVWDALEANCEAVECPCCTKCF